MFLDEVTVELIAGNGGNGCMAYRREKYIEMETYDDDKIVVYYVDSRVYIKYAYKNYVVYFMYQDNSLN